MQATRTFTSKKREHQVFIEDENKCCLCGTELKFVHKYDYTTLIVKEDAHCPACRVRLKTREHRLQ